MSSLIFLFFFFHSFSVYKFLPQQLASLAFPKKFTETFLAYSGDSLMYNVQQVGSSCEFLIMPDHFQKVNRTSSSIGAVRSNFCLLCYWAPLCGVCSNCHFLRRGSFSREGCWQPFCVLPLPWLSSSRLGHFIQADSNCVVWKAGTMDTADCYLSLATKCGYLFLWGSGSQSVLHRPATSHGNLLEVLILRL